MPGQARPHGSGRYGAEERQTGVEVALFFDFFFFTTEDAFLTVYLATDSGVQKAKTRESTTASHFLQQYLLEKI